MHPPHLPWKGGWKDHVWGTLYKAGSLPFQTPVVRAGICSGSGAGVGDRRAVNLQIAEGGRAPLNEDIFFLYMWTGECWVTVIKGSQGPGTSSSHSHENTSSGEEEENCEGNAHDDKRESLFSPIFKKPEHFRQKLFKNAFLIPTYYLKMHVLLMSIMIFIWLLFVYGGGHRSLKGMFKTCRKSDG